MRKLPRSYSSLTAINPFNFFLKLGYFRGLHLCQRPKIQHVLTFLPTNSIDLYLDYTSYVYSQEPTG